MKHAGYSRFLPAVLALAARAASCAASPPLRPAVNTTADRLERLLDDGKVLALVDTRTEYEYRKGHIPGALSITPEKLDVLSTLPPEDRNGHVVFYRGGPT